MSTGTFLGGEEGTIYTMTLLWIWDLGRGGGGGGGGGVFTCCGHFANVFKALILIVLSVFAGCYQS